MNGNAHSLGSSFNKIPPEHNVAQTNKHVNHYHPSSAKPRDYVSSHHKREHRPEQLENNGFQQYKVAANSMAAHTHLNPHPSNHHSSSQQQHIAINNEKRYTNFKLTSDPMLRKGAPKIYRYDGVSSDPNEQPVPVRDPRNRKTILDKLWSHRESAELMLTRFKIDKNYVGVPPAIEVSITNLNDNINNKFLEDMLRKFDNCEEIEILYHPKTNKHLGLAKVVFMTPAGARQCVQKIHKTSVMGNSIDVFFDPFFKSIESIYESIINPPVAPAQTDALPFLDPNSLEKLPLTNDFAYTTDSAMMGNDSMHLHIPSTSGFENQSFFQSFSQGFSNNQQWTDNPNTSPIRESLETRINNLIQMQSVGKLHGFLSHVDLSDVRTSLRLSGSPDHRRPGLSNRIDDSDAFLGTPPSPFVSASEFLKWHKFTKKVDTGENTSEHGDEENGQKSKDAKTADDDDDRMSLSSLSSDEKMDEINVTNGTHNAYPTNSEQNSSVLMNSMGPAMWKPDNYNPMMADKNLHTFNGLSMPPFMFPSFLPNYSRFSRFSLPSTLGLPAGIFSQDMSPTKQWTKPKEKDNRSELISNILAESSKCLVKDLKDILTKDILKRIVENYSFKMFDKWWEDNERKSKSTTENKTNTSETTARSESTARGKDINIPLFNPLFNNSLSQNRHDQIVPNFEFGLTRGMRSVIPKMPSFKRKITKRSPNRAFNDKLSDISDDEYEVRKPRREGRRDEERRRRRRHSVSSQSSRSSRSSSRSSSSSSSSSSSGKSSKSSSADDRSSSSSSEDSSASEKSDESDSDSSASSDASASSASSKRSSSSASSKSSARSLSSRSSRSSVSSLVRKQLSPISSSQESFTSSPAKSIALPEESKVAPKLKPDDLSDISDGHESDGLDSDKTDTAGEDNGISESELEEDRQLQKKRATEFEATQGLMELSLGFRTKPPAPAERIYQETFDNYFAFEHSYIIPRPTPTPEQVAEKNAAEEAAATAAAASIVPPVKPKGKVGRPRKEKLDSNNKENQQQKGRKRKTNEAVAVGDVPGYDLVAPIPAVASEWRNAKRKNVAATNDLIDSLFLQDTVDDVANKAAALSTTVTEPLVTFPSRDSTAEAKVLHDFLENGIDEEDVSYLKRSFEEMMQENVPNMAWLNDIYWVDAPMPPKRRRNEAAEGEATSGRVHKSGCARTEGFYKQLPSEKIRYFFQETNVKNKLQQTEREARTNQRRFVANAQTETYCQSEWLKFNQLKLRKKQLKFSKSKIHEWGLFAMETIAIDDMVIEYVGVQQRAIMADTLERKYEKSGIGSSYLFKIDSETIIDATLRGNVARFINHSCTPNCTAKVITVEGQKKIVIYSKKEIHAGEEITYDYKFPIEETNKIKCLCQTSGCRGFLN